MKLLKIKEVSTLLSVSPYTIRKMVKEEGFPAPIELSKQLQRWKQDDVVKWVQKAPKIKRLKNG